MNSLILLLCVVCYFVSNIYQNRFSTTLGKRSYPVNYFQITWMLFAVLAFTVFELATNGLQFSALTLEIAPISGIITVLSGMALISAMSCGPLSLTILIFSMNVIIPSLLAIPFLGEAVSVFQIIGLIIIIIVFFLTNFDVDAVGKHYSRKWWLLCFASVLLMGTNNFLSRVHQKYILDYALTREQREYSIVCFLSGIILSVLIILITKPRQDRRPGVTPYRFKKKTFFIPAIILSVTIGTANLCNVYLAGTDMPAIIQYPVVQLGTLMITALYAIIFLHEKPTKVTILCLTLGMGAIFLMNF